MEEAGAEEREGTFSLSCHCHLLPLFKHSWWRMETVVILDDLFLHLLRNMNEQSIFYISDNNCWFAISLFVFVRIQNDIL